MITDEEHNNRVRARVSKQGASNPFRWCSMGCVCEECLDADYGFYVYGYSTTNHIYFNMEGLTRGC